MRDMSPPSLNAERQPASVFRLVVLLALAALALLRPGAALAQQAPIDDNPYRLDVRFESRPHAAIRHAREQIAAGDIAGAIRDLAVYVAAHPTEIKPARFLGDLYFRAGRLKRAAFTYRELLIRFPYDKATHDRLGIVYAAEHRVDSAIEEFTKSLPSSDAVSDLVTLHRLRGDLDDFQAAIERAVNDDPRSAALQLELGQLYLARHHDARAMSAFQRALRLKPQAAVPSYNGMALAYLDLSQDSSALKVLAQCLRIDPSSYPCLTNQGAAYLGLSQFGNAQRWLQLAHVRAPERPEAIVNLGYLADARGHWKQAVTLYAQAIRYGPYTREAYIDLGLAYITHKLYPLAEEALVKGIAFAPYDGRLHVLLGDVYQAEGRKDLALPQYRIAEKSHNSLAREVARERTGDLSAPPKP